MQIASEDQIVDFVRTWSDKTDIPAGRFLPWIGVGRSKYHDWVQRFGAAYPQLASTRDGIDRYLVACTCVGIEAATMAVYAPYGLDELWAGILRPNPANLQIERFREKAASYQARWPWLQITGL